MKGHECKATQRPSRPIRLRVGPCISRKRFRPRSCGNCPGACCKPVVTHTIRVLFACATRRGHALTEGEGSFGDEDQLVGGWGGKWLRTLPTSLLSLARPGSDLWEMDFYNKISARQMSSAQIQESQEIPSIILGGHNSRNKRSPREIWRDEEGGEIRWDIKPNLPKETRQPKRRRIDVRRGGRTGGRGKRSASFDWSHESASEEELVTLSVMWIEKCKCFESCPKASLIELGEDEEGAETISVEEEDDGEWDGDYKVISGTEQKILRRVHKRMES